MTQASKLRIERRANSNEVVVRMLLSHVMESGQRKDAKDNTIPAWFIQTVLVRRGKQILFNAQLGPSVARNPFFEFVLSGLVAGELLELVWRDNRGEIRRDVFTVTL